MHHSGRQKIWYISLTPTFEKIVYCTLPKDVATMQPLADETTKSSLFFLLPPLWGQYIFSHICCRTDRYIVAHILLHSYHRMTVWMCYSDSLDIQLKKQRYELMSLKNITQMSIGLHYICTGSLNFALCTCWVFGIPV